MSSILPSTLNPPVKQGALNFSNETASSTASAATDNKTGSAPKVDFKSLLMNSNEEVTKKRATDNKGDLSKAKNDDEFFKMLEQKTKPQRTPKNTLEKDDFLKLFVTQLKNQDPLNPQDSAAMAAQLAQFNSLEQMMNMNKSLEKMNTSQDNGRTWGLVDYIGKEVQVNNGRIIAHGGKLNQISFNTEKPVSAAELQVFDEAGILVAKKDIGNVTLGEHDLEWDGKNTEGKQISDGLYSFKIMSKGGEAEEQIPIKATSKVKITGIDLQDKSGNAFFTDLGKLSLNDISAVGSLGFLDKKKSDEKKTENNNNQSTEKLDNKSNEKPGEKRDLSSNEVIDGKTEVKKTEENSSQDPNKKQTVASEEHASLFPEEPFIPAGPLPSQLR